MKTEEHTAILAAAISLLTIIIQIVLNRVNSVKIEKLKSKLEISKKYSEELIKAYSTAFLGSQQDELEFLKNFLKHLQMHKEIVKDIISQKGDFNKKKLQEAIKSNQKTLNSLYANSYINMEQKIQTKSHYIKNVAYEITETATDLLNKPAVEIENQLKKLCINFNSLQEDYYRLSREILDDYFHKIKSIASEST